MALIESISGIRGSIGGKVGENLTPLDIVKFTTAYSRFILQTKGEGATVVLGRDARISGEMVNSIIEGTLLGCGINVINVGLCTTPGVELAVVHHHAQGGIIITASHNEKEWNALKLLNDQGEFLNAAEGDLILNYAKSMDWEYPSVNKLGVVKLREDFNDKHIAQVLSLSYVDVESIRARKLKIVVDAVNSVGGVVIPKLLRELGCEVVEINCTPNGDFAHNPEPLPEHLTQISEVIRTQGADLGVVVDPDVDRLALVCENGNMFGEEYTLVAVADFILSKTKGNTVSNLSSSRALRDVTNTYGATYTAAAVGEVNVVATMKATSAIIGGEGNGGVILPELHYGRDALVGVVLFLTHFASKGLIMSELRSSYPAYYASKNKKNLDDSIDVGMILSTIKERYATEQITDIDGVKIDFADSWVHLRKSNTEAVVRIYTEAKSQAEADRLAVQFIGEIEDIINN